MTRVQYEWSDGFDGIALVYLFPREYLMKEDEVFAYLAPWMGTFTAAVIVTMCDPRQYPTARQLEKACGMILQ